MPLSEMRIQNIYQSVIPGVVTGEGQSWFSGRVSVMHAGSPRFSSTGQAGGLLPVRVDGTDLYRPRGFTQYKVA